MLLITHSYTAWQITDSSLSSALASFGEVPQKQCWKKLETQYTKLKSKKDRKVDQRTQKLSKEYQYDEVQQSDKVETYLNKLIKRKFRGLFKMQWEWSPSYISTNQRSPLVSMRIDYLVGSPTSEISSLMDHISAL